MWKDHLGEDANLHNFIAILEKRTDSKDSATHLKNTFVHKEAEGASTERKEERESVNMAVRKKVEEGEKAANAKAVADSSSSPLAQSLPEEEVQDPELALSKIMERAITSKELGECKFAI